MMKSEPMVDFLAPLADAADATAFTEAMDRLDWAHAAADDYMGAIELALAAGAHLPARTLAAAGAARFPAHAELVRAARILAPPTVRSAGTRSGSYVQQHHEWLKAHREQYRGEWVALGEGRLLGHAGTIDALCQEVQPAADVLFVRVN